MKALGHVSVDDPLREPLDDRGLPHARLADQDRVVLRAARQDLDHAPDLLVAPDHRVELPGLGGLGQVATELGKCLVAPLRVLRSDALAATNLLDPGEDLVAGRRLEREEEVLARDEVVLELRALSIGAVEHLPERRRGLRQRLRATRRRSRCCLLLGLGAKVLPVGEELLVEQREQQVLRIDLRVTAAARQLLRGSDRLLALDRQLVEVHQSFLRTGGCAGR